MSLSVICIKQIAIMFILVAVGFICGKKGFIDKKTNAGLSAIVLTLVNPVKIFMSYQQEYREELLHGLLISMLLAFLTHLMLIILVSILYRGKSDAASVVERFAAVYSNCGFMGIPLLSGIFGDEGVFYLTGYITMFNIFAWTHGVIIFSGKKDIKSLMHAVTSPAVISVAAGFLCFILRIRLPEIVSSAASSLGSMNTPLAMIVAGVTISSTDLKNDLKNLRIYRAAALRLIISPLLIWAVFRWFPIPSTVFITVLTASACPSAATCTMFAIRYGKDPQLSSVIFAFTTLLCGVTLPLVIMLGSV
ncbi:MAG: AEC family transporter [Huintestinicola sp.]